MRKLTQKAILFTDGAKGGYLQLYNICDGEKVIGQKTVEAATRRGPISTIYSLGDLTFDNAKDFAAAYEATLAAPDR